MPMLMQEGALPIQQIISALLMSLLTAWGISWPIRWAVVEYLTTARQSEAAIVGLEKCSGKFCACENKWTLQMPDGKRHKLCTQRIEINPNNPIEHGKKIAVSERRSLFDYSIE